jgi:hypothetical protein
LGRARWVCRASSVNLDPSGKPITDRNAVPAVGDLFISTDNNYLGNHKKHAKAYSATDHLACTLTAVDLQAGHLIGLCDGQIALPGGMILVDRQTIDFSENTTKITITGGTGKYAKAKGTLTSISYNEKSDNSDLVIDVRY